MYTGSPAFDVLWCMNWYACFTAGICGYVNDAQILGTSPSSVATSGETSLSVRHARWLVNMSSAFSTSNCRAWQKR